MIEDSFAFFVEAVAESDPLTRQCHRGLVLLPISKPKPCGASEQELVNFDATISEPPKQVCRATIAKISKRVKQAPETRVSN